MRLEIERLRKWLGGRRVLDGIELVCEGAGVSAILGANGTGKSTLLRIVAGVLEPDGGKVRLDGRRLDVGERAGLRYLGYVPEAADPLPHLTVGELLALVTALKRVAAPRPELVERLGVQPILVQRIGTLSLGQRRRAGLLAALIGDPWLLVLDEPTNGLDPGAVELLADLLKEHVQRGGAVLLATHDLDFCAAVSARRLRLHAGRLEDEADSGGSRRQTVL
jgi:ABC-2 type transport system ATP-binding protein